MSQIHDLFFDQGPLRLRKIILRSSQVRLTVRETERGGIPLTGLSCPAMPVPPFSRSILMGIIRIIFICSPSFFGTRAPWLPTKECIYMTLSIERLYSWNIARRCTRDDVENVRICPLDRQVNGGRKRGENLLRAAEKV